MHRLNTMPVFLLAATLCAFGAESQAPDPDEVNARIPELVDVVIASLGELQPSHTAAEWVRTHPKEKLETLPSSSYSQSEREWGDWCFQAVRHFWLSPFRVARRAFFYPPAAPPDWGLPQGKPDPAAARRGCVLGMIWVEIPGGVILPEEFTMRMELALTRRYGKPLGKQGCPSPKELWREPACRRQGNVIVLFGNSEAGMGYAAAAHLSPPDETFLRESFPRGGSDLAPEEVRRIRQLGELAALDEAEISSLLALREQLSRLWSAEDVFPQSALLASIRSLRALAKDRKPARRVALYLLIDEMVNGIDGYYLNGPTTAEAENQRVKTRRYPKSKLQIDLEALGTQFGYGGLGDVWLYERSWLGKALSLNEPGRSGQLAFLELMKRGFDTTCCCAAGVDQFEEVIRRGRTFVAQATEKDVQAEAHFLIAQAYSDITALAQGAVDDDYADAQAYAPRARSAHARAVHHYRTGLAADSRSEQAHRAWRQAWKLQAGLPPPPPAFYCIYD